MFETKAQEKLKKKSKKLEKINVEKKNEEKKMNKKVGLLQKATTLYKQERFSEAFNIIAKAVKQVKTELLDTAE